MIHERRTGQKMKRVCEERGLTVQEIQKKLGIGAHQSIYNWFNGRSMPTLDNYYSLCKMLGVAMESMIVEDTGDREQSVREQETGAGEADRDSLTDEGCLHENMSQSISGTCIFRTDFFEEKIRSLGRAERFRAVFKKQCLLII